MYRLIPFLLLIGLLISSCNAKDKAKSESYVVLSPEIAEIICALGAIDMISGVTSECSYPPELLAKASVGNFGAVDFEKVIAQKPSIVFTSALEQDAISADLLKLGIKVEKSYPKSLSEMRSEILRIGNIIKRKEQAQTLIKEMDSTIAEIYQSTSGKAKPKVYIEIYRDPLMSVADNSFVGELIETAGGDNIFHILERDYARVKAEDVISAAPDIIICYSQDTLANILARKGWQNIPAIRNKMVFFESDLNPDLLLRAGPRSMQGLQALRDIFAKWQEAGV